jgi:nitrogen fixation/metabolism regulation signal transduction histidine kinase
MWSVDSTQPYGSPLHQALDTICKATERGGKMVKSLLNFARQSPVENHELDMNAILKEQVGLLERTTLAKVRLQMDLETELRPIRGYPPINDAIKPPACTSP